MAFSFLEYLFFVLEMFTFLYYANVESNDFINRSTLKYWSSVLQTWQQKSTSQKKRNDTFCVVAMATPSAPVSCCEKPKFAHLQPFEKGQRVLLGTYVVPILS